MDLFLKDLENYTEIKGYYYDPLLGKTINYSSGIKYVRDNGYSYLITDILIFCKKLINESKINFCDFITITFEKNKEDKWTFIIKKEYNDEKEPTILHQCSYDLCDSKKNLKFHFLDSADTKVLLLTSEY